MFRPGVEVGTSICQVRQSVELPIGCLAVEKLDLQDPLPETVLT